MSAISFNLIWITPGIGKLNDSAKSGTTRSFICVNRFLKISLLTLEDTRSTPNRGSIEVTSEGIATLSVDSGRESENLQVSINMIINRILNFFIF